jgi:hypothetical protein
MDYTQLLITSLLSLAGSSRLPPKLIIKDTNVSEQNILESMENSIQEYIKTIPDFGKKLHNADAKNKILIDITNIISTFDCTIKDSYQKLWANFLNKNNNNAENLALMNKIMEKMQNKKLKSTLECNNRTPSKINNSVKTILNVTPPFASIFMADVLDKKEQMILNNIIQHNVNHTNKIDTFIEMANFKTEEDLNVSLFYSEISQVTDPKLRNQYYNSFMCLLVSKLTIKVGTNVKLIPIDNNEMKNLEHIFMQVYIFFINNETIKTVDDKIVQYLNIKNMSWFTYQINEFPNKLCPNWNFKPKGFKLDTWQKNTIKQIDAKQNIILSLPTSAGKTVISTYAIRTFSKVCYLVPSEALAYQLTGMMLASLVDIDNHTKNVRHETMSLSFKKYPTKPDDIIIATPIEFYKMLAEQTIEPNFDYIIIDEFHNITDSDLGPYIEFIFKFATYYNIPLMALSATIPNFPELKSWFEKLASKDVFGVYERKRFFNQKRYCIKDNKIMQVNPLDHMKIETLKSDEFTHIGLYPQEILKLRNQVIKTPLVESEPDIVSLDKLHIMEGDIFSYLKSQSDDVLKTMFNLSELKTESTTPFRLFKIMRECKDMRMMPMLIFKMDPQECMNIYHTMLNMLKEYEVLMYPSFNSVNKIIEAYYDTYERECKKLEVNKDKSDKKDNSDKSDKSSGKEKSIEELQDELKDTLYGSSSGVKAQLEEFYRDFINTKINPEDLDRFNTKYGGDLNEEFIITMRKKHAMREMRMYNNPENLRLRNIFASHPQCRMIDTTVSYDEMKKIKRKINSEITRDTRLKYGVNAPIPLINYSHPFMLGIERGIICYNTLMSPALQRVCQQLINDHPFVTFSDKSLAVGINYPIKTVMLLGELSGKDELEKIDNTLAHQACGRAGRRGLDSEGYIIYVGVDISEILIPKYTKVVRNSVERMTLLIPDNVSDNFKNYILNEIKPDVPEPLWSCKNLIDIDKLAEEMFRLQTTSDLKNIKVILDDGTIDNIDENELNFSKKIKSDYKTLEEIKAELLIKFSPSKEKSSVFVSDVLENIPITNNNDSDEKDYTQVKLETFESWEDDADEEEINNKKIKESKQTIANIESSFM